MLHNHSGLPSLTLFIHGFFSRYLFLCPYLKFLKSPFGHQNDLILVGDEEINHCLVLLQIATSTIKLIDTVYQARSFVAVTGTVQSPAVTPPELDKFQSEQRPSSLPVAPAAALPGNLTPSPTNHQPLGNQHLAADSLLQVMAIFLWTQSWIFLTQAVRMDSMIHQIWA